MPAELMPSNDNREKSMQKAEGVPPLGPRARFGVPSKLRPVDISAIQSSQTTHRTHTHTYLRDPQSFPPATTCPTNDERIPRPRSAMHGQNPRAGQSVGTYHRPPQCGSDDPTVLRPPSSVAPTLRHCSGPELPFMSSPSGSVLEAVRGRAPGTPAVSPRV